MKINLHYSLELFTLTVEDDGIGLGPELMCEKAGRGLKNIQNKAAIIVGEHIF